jgi:hypothetical protein
MFQKALSRSVHAGLLAAAVGAVAVFAGTEPSRADALSLRQKVADVAAFGERTSQRPNRTTITENELNAYLVYDARDQLPPGVVDPSITIAGAGRLSARAVVDLDAVRRQKSSRGLLDPLSYAGGRLAITAAGVLTAANGVGRFALESATMAGVPIPKSILQEVVSYYSRTPGNPAGIGLDDPFPLPARIREIQVETGRAVVIQ